MLSFLILIIGFINISADNKTDRKDDYRPAPYPDLVLEALPVSRISELQRGDILVKPNFNLIPGTCQVWGGSSFGHAAIVIQGASDTNVMELLSKTRVFESQARDLPGEYQVRQAKAYSPGNDYRTANHNFDQLQTGYRYRLRPSLSSAQIDTLINYLLTKNEGLSSWHAMKKFQDGGSQKENPPESQYWYCSLLIWQAFYDVLGIDLDPNGGFFVYPNDLVCSPFFNNTDTLTDRRTRF